MKYVKTYTTLEEATADTTVVSPLVGFCVENGQVFNFDSGEIDEPLMLTVDGNEISVSISAVTTVTISIMEITVTFVPGMTWAQWYVSEYNDTNLVVDGTIQKTIGQDILVLTDNDRVVEDSEEINEYAPYGWRFVG